MGALLRLLYLFLVMGQTLVPLGRRMSATQGVKAVDLLRTNPNSIQSVSPKGFGSL